MNLLLTLLIPLIGTILGAMFVYFIKDKTDNKMESLFLSLASGVMVAASFFSLILPSIELSANLEKFAFFPAVIGFALGMFVLILIDKFLDKYKGDKDNNQTILFLAVTIHNIPEGMAVGVMLAGLLVNNFLISFVALLSLVVGVALQNIPEGAVISTSLKSKGMNKHDAFMYGAFTGVVEPLASILTILLTRLVTPILPYFLSFAAGAMMYVVVDDLIPESKKENKSKIGVVGFCIGFIVMMVLDITLG